MNKEMVLACDLGGTNLRMAAIDDGGRIISRFRAETPRTERADEIACAIADAAEKCRGAVGRIGEVKALAVAVPAIIDSKSGITLKAPNVPALDGFRLTAALSSKLNLPVVLENDANAAAVGEHSFGAARGFENAVAVTLGTGVGGGIIINGKILRGIDGTAGEIGHICVEPFGAPCGCGSRGCLEQYASATAVTRIARELENQYPKSSLRNEPRPTSADIYEAGTRGDELALEVFRRMGFYLGVALADLVNVLNPEVIVVGGGASAGWDLFIHHLKAQICERAFGEPAERVKIVRAHLGDDAGLMGAARLALDLPF